MEGLPVDTGSCSFSEIKKRSYDWCSYAFGNLNRKYIQVFYNGIVTKRLIGWYLR